MVSVLTQVKSGALVEDNRVELKSDWPDVQKASRQIAAHANSSFGSDILWIIGADEKKGIVGCAPKDLAAWWPQIQSNFGGVTPSLLDLVVSFEGETTVGLLFETNRPPYVVKNPSYGSSGGGPVSLEVPWREGTSVKSAGRNELIRLLVPRTSLPQVEVLDGWARLSSTNKSRLHVENAYRIDFHISTYLVPHSESLVIPYHRCGFEISSSASKPNPIKGELVLYAPRGSNLGGSVEVGSVTIEDTSSELVVNGPGKCEMRGDTGLEKVPAWIDQDLTLKVEISVVNSDIPKILFFNLISNADKGNEDRTWKLKESG